MESTLDFLKRHLKEAGSDRWPAIASAAGVAKTLPRKLAYGDRENPGIQTVQPLVDFFREIEAGTRALPPAQANLVQPSVAAFTDPPADSTLERRVSTEPNAFPDLDRRAAVQGA